MKKTVMLFVSVCLTACSSSRTAVGYRAPLRNSFDDQAPGTPWAQRLSSERTPLAGTIDPWLALVSRYQLERCESIAVAYEAKATARNDIVTAVTITGGALTVVGGAGVVGSVAKLPGLTTEEQLALGVAGLVTAGVGALATAIVNTYAVSGGPKQQVAAAVSSRAAGSSFREALQKIRSSPTTADADSSIALAALCNARRSCEPSAVDVNELGCPFADPARAASDSNVAAGLARPVAGDNMELKYIAALDAYAAWRCGEPVANPEVCLIRKELTGDARFFSTFATTGLPSCFDSKDAVIADPTTSAPGDWKAQRQMDATGFVYDQRCWMP